MKIVKKAASIIIASIITISAVAFPASAETTGTNPEKLSKEHLEALLHTRIIDQMDFDSSRAVRECRNCGSGDLYFVKRTPYLVLDDGGILYEEVYHCRSCNKNSSYYVAHYS